MQTGSAIVSPLFQSTHPLRGATPPGRTAPPPTAISIHAPLAGCDYLMVTGAEFAVLFQSTHPLRGATFPPPNLGRWRIFQSTHPLRGATRKAEIIQVQLIISIHAPLAGCDRCGARFARRSSYFNPRTPCGVRRVCCCCFCCFLPYFNPRTPCGVRLYWRRIQRLPPLFQSTHPLRGATPLQIRFSKFPDISIHAPLAGCDHPMIIWSLEIK